MRKPRPHLLDLRWMRSRTRSAGQIAVLFAGSIVLFVLLCGLVVDIAYYWVGSLQAQRAADAAALAGAVYLPGDTTTAYATARATATQNGFTAGGSTLSVTPLQDTDDPRQLDVAIRANVGTFFSRVVGIQSFPVSVTAKGVYVLPVPMGSPDAYYGVGSYSVNKSTTNTTNYTSASAPEYHAVTPAVWTNPNNAWTTSASYATSATNNQAQQWSNMNIPTIAGATLDGFVVSFHAGVSIAGAACKVNVDASWDGGNSWTSPALATPRLNTTLSAPYAIGSPTSLAPWGSGHTWVAGDFPTNQFRVRLTYLKGSFCGWLSVNALVVTVYSHTTSTTWAMVTTDGVSDGATFLDSRGAWGASITKGGNEQNGDAYATANNGGPGGYTPTYNAKYDAQGYDYTVSLPSGGDLKLFDPGFCAMGSNGGGGSMGTGDHWIGTAGTPVSTYYTVWDTNGKPGLRSAWTELYTSGSLFEAEKGYDPDNVTPGNQDPWGGHPLSYYIPGGATSGCSTATDTYHNAWWTIPIPAGSLAPGTYAIQVQTTKTAHTASPADSAQNQSTNAENMFAIEASGGGAQVHGNGRMVVYNNLPVAGTQQFYLAQIDRASGAGKTALIDLFDAGDISGTGTLQVLSPDGGIQQAVNFSYTTDANCKIVSAASPCSGTNVSQIITTTPSGQATNNTWIHIQVPVPATYGSPATGGLWNDGWWQIRYTVTQSGNDTTTWQVSLAGNPVHLLVP